MRFNRADHSPAIAETKSGRPETRTQPARDDKLARAERPTGYDVVSSVTDVADHFDTQIGGLGPFVTAKDSPYAAITAEADFELICGSRPTELTEDDQHSATQAVLGDGTIVRLLHYGPDTFIRYTNAAGKVDNVVVYFDERARILQPRHAYDAVAFLAGNDVNLNTDSLEVSRQFSSPEHALCMAARDFGVLCGDSDIWASGADQIAAFLPDGSRAELCYDAGYGPEFEIDTQDGSKQRFFVTYGPPFPEQLA